MLTSQGGINVLTQVYDSREAKNIVGELEPDVVLVDFNMPHLNGIELTKQLISQSKEIKVLILSMYNEDIYIDRFKRSGMQGIYLKPPRWKKSLPRSGPFTGEQHIFRQCQKRTFTPMTFSWKSSSFQIAKWKSIRLVKNGLTTKEIADQLNISFYTAETHRKNIKLKIGVKAKCIPSICVQHWPKRERSQLEQQKNHSQRS